MQQQLGSHFRKWPGKLFPIYIHCTLGLLLYTENLVYFARFLLCRLQFVSWKGPVIFVSHAHAVGCGYLGTVSCVYLPISRTMKTMFRFLSLGWMSFITVNCASLVMTANSVLHKHSRIECFKAEIRLCLERIADPAQWICQRKFIRLLTRS